MKFESISEAHTRVMKNLRQQRYATRSAARGQVTRVMRRLSFRQTMKMLRMQYELSAALNKHYPYTGV